VKIAAFLVLLFAEVIRGDASYNVLNHEDPCISLCEKAPTTMHGIVCVAVFYAIITFVCSFCSTMNYLVLGYVQEILLPTRLQIFQFGRFTLRMGVKQFEWHEGCLRCMYV